MMNTIYKAVDLIALLHNMESTIVVEIHFKSHIYLHVRSVYIKIHKNNGSQLLRVAILWVNSDLIFLGPSE